MASLGIGLLAREANYGSLAGEDMRNGLRCLSEPGGGDGQGIYRVDLVQTDPFTCNIMGESARALKLTVIGNGPTC